MLQVKFIVKLLYCSGNYIVYLIIDINYEIK